LLKLLGLGKVTSGIRLSEDNLFVGRYEHLLELKALLGLSQKGVSAPGPEVGIVGIKGMGGVGKSTMAKRLYDDPEVRAWFVGNLCWVEVRQLPSEERVCMMQSQIIQELCNWERVEIRNPTFARELIRKRLEGRKVLIFLDDAWENVATTSGVVSVGDLSPGSRILITSRVQEAIGGHVFNLDALKEGPAWELFCWHAFKRKKPPEELASMAEEAAKRCLGLPLVIEFIGSQLAKRTVAWDTENSLKDFLQSEFDELDGRSSCRSILERSFTSLPPNLRDAFILLGGLWPSTVEFRSFERAKQNLGAALYGDFEIGVSEDMAGNILHQLDSRSLNKVEEGEDGPQIIIHDILLATAKRAASEEQAFPLRARRMFGTISKTICVRCSAH
jgi:disease resistance protein RPM1